RSCWWILTPSSGTWNRGERTEDRGQRTEDRGQRTEDRRQRTEERGQKALMGECNRDHPVRERSGRLPESLLRGHGDLPSHDAISARRAICPGQAGPEVVPVSLS